MARKIVWTDRAISELTEISAFIERESPAIAALVCSRIVARTEQAAEFPFSGRRVPGRDENVRELFWRSYRVIYRVDAPKILILTVVHGSRVLEESL
ncbi:MAG: type II toxin-antitoxin system RelE/ParE family toxin [Acidobacteria bacterium]|nr:type II toxin-antitoxin system RelE/ParE family toxin [Acidobacteriota bacterium]